MSLRHARDDWFKCHVCGHLMTVTRPQPQPPESVRFRLPAWTLMMLGFAAAMLARRGSQAAAEPQVQEFPGRLIRAAHERRRPVPRAS